MEVKKIAVYAHFDKLAMYKEAIAHGMSESAANYFMYFTEISIDLEVDFETGKVISASMPWKAKGS